MALHRVKRVVRNVEGRGQATPRYFVPQIEVLEDRALPALSVVGIASPAQAAVLAKELAGPGVTISNVSFTGTTGGTATASAGSFTGGTPAIGFNNGIILSNGHAKDVVGPSTVLASTDLGLPGDPDLDALAGVTPNEGFDATTLSFDFVPQGRSLTFQYVFASDEYNQFVGTQFDDVFGFFVNGQNVALIPGTNQPVSVNTVNKNTNSQFFIDNDPTDFGNAPGPVPFAMHGLTKVLTAEVDVTPGVVNHIKLGVQDTGDAIFDSNVFIKAGSFSATAIPVGYKPFRYVFNQATQTYVGNVTALNIGNVPLAGPIAIALENLPPQVTLVNATGTTKGANGQPIPAISIPQAAALIPGIPVRATVVLTDPPPPVFLSTFFEGYMVDVLNGKAAQGL